MEPLLLRTGFRRAVISSYNPAKRRVLFQPRRFYATPTESSPQSNFRAAPPIRFNADNDQFARTHAELMSDDSTAPLGAGRRRLLDRVRIVPASPSYFTATPRYTDDLLYLSSLLRKYQLLPLAEPGQGPRISWKTIQQYRTELGEPVRVKGFSALLQLLKRLHQIHPSLFPSEVEQASRRFKRSVQPHQTRARPIVIDEFGRARAVGRRKSSHAVAYLVEGEGECLINGRTLNEYFGRLHDRESAVWALKATQRLDKYNTWCIVKGGGTTGQAEAITLAVAKALMVHEPDLKTALRRAGTITRDRRRVERKKPGKLKARKMPAWVKR